MLRPWIVLACLGGWAGRSPAATSGQEERPVPAFPAEAQAITVDVTVLDAGGHPARGLSRDDFALLEDGRPQAISAFEPRTLAPAGTAGGDSGPEPAMVSNEHPAGAEGRMLVFLVDDLGIQPTSMAATIRALSQWLTRAADPRDQVTIATSSGQVWWSDTVARGRGDLEAVLGRIRGLRQGAGGRDAMSDYESYTIDVLGTPIAAPSAQPAGPPAATGTCLSGETAARPPLVRVVDRWFTTGACICDPNNIQASIASCRFQVMGRARQQHGAATSRAVSLLATIERVSSGLAWWRARKSILLLSEGFLRDTDQRAFERALDASRRGNTTVSFVDVRGLVGPPSYGADHAAPPQAVDFGTVSVENQLAETAGAEYLADQTGGSVVRDTNDLAGAVRRIADESSVYYLLGYQSDRPPDGRWHRLQVRVSRPGLRVRARPGYYATAEPAAPPASPPGRSESGKALPARPLDPALAVGGERDALPLRMAPYVFETDADGRVRVLVALELDTSALRFSDSGRERTATVDVTVVGVSRDHPVQVALDSRVELGVAETVANGWWTFTRELRLPPGPALLRTLVRDAATGRSGMVAERIEIPGGGAPYLSTPVLTDALAKDMVRGPRVLPVAHSRFPPRGRLYCAYEVYVEPGRDELTSLPEVRSSYALSDESGRIVSSEAPTPIAIALGGRLSRLYEMPLDRLAPRRYRLTIQASDPRQGLDLRWTGFFVVEAPAGASATSP